MRINLFKRTSNLEKQIQESNTKLEGIYQLLIASMLVQNIHPRILKEKSKDYEAIYKYLIGMTNEKNNK